MKKTTFFFLLLLFSITAYSQGAVKSKPIRIAHFDLDSLLDVLPAMRTVGDKVYVFSQKQDSIMNAMQAEYNSKLNELNNSNNLSPEKKTILESEIAELGARIKAFEIQSQSDRNKYRDELVEPIFAQIRAVANEVAAERGYDIVIDSSRVTGVVFYANPKDDILTQIYLRMIQKK